MISFPGARSTAGAGVLLFSMCMHKKNSDTLRETVNLLASLGVRSMKVGSMMELGEWAQPEVADLQLPSEESFAIFEKYFPKYFEDNAPLSICRLFLCVVRS